jgi:hypothetical protein
VGSDFASKAAASVTRKLKNPNFGKMAKTDHKAKIKPHHCTKSVIILVHFHGNGKWQLCFKSSSQCDQNIEKSKFWINGQNSPKGQNKATLLQQNC